MHRFSSYEVKRTLKSKRSKRLHVSESNNTPHPREGNALIATLLELVLLIVVISFIAATTTSLFDSFRVQSLAPCSALVQPIFRLSALSDDRYLWVQRGLGEIAKIDLSTGTATSCFLGIDAKFTKSAVSEDGVTFFGAFEDRDFCVFRDQQILVFDTRPESFSNLYGLSANGNIAVRVVEGTQVHVWDIAKEDDIREFDFVLPDAAERIALDRRGERMMVLTAAKYLDLIETRTGQLLSSITSIPSNESPTTDPEFTKDGTGLLIAFGATVFMYDLDHGTIDWSYKVDRDSHGIQNLAISSDGQWVAASSVSSGVVVLNRSTGEVEHKLPDTISFCRIAFSPGCDRLYRGSCDGTVKVFSLTEQRELEPISVVK